MISFIGAGKVGTALSLYFKQKGLQIGGFYSRTHSHALDACKLTGSTAFSSISELLKDSSMVWITVSDDSLETVAKEIAQLDIPAHIKAFIHTSGVHSNKALQSIQEKGFATYSAHPLMAFGKANESAKQLSDIYFSLETSSETKDDYLLRFFKKTENSVLRIDTDKKELYHCAASVLSNYLVTLLNLAYEMFAESGMTKNEIKEATAPLLQSTLANIAKNDEMKNALTGAIKRGDRKTVVKHLDVLKEVMPNKIILYKELGKETMDMLQDYRLKDLLG
ncbi:MAG: Rossmann-like and DUF2520 domain-containing protein [Dysgonamonadaceae bacterium]